MDVAIIGGGVAGCYCAYRLARASNFSDIQLFESSHRIGGRLWSVSLDGIEGSLGEIGGMYIGDMQHNVYELVTKELKLDISRVDWTRKNQYLRGKYLDDSTYEQNPTAVPFTLNPEEIGKSPGQLLAYALQRIVPEILDLWPISIEPPRSPRATIMYLRQFRYNGRPLHDWGFWNVLSNVISNEAYSLLTSTLGSVGVFRNSNAYDALWTFMQEMAPTQEYYKIAKGSQQLPLELVEGSLGRVKVSLGHRLVSITKGEGALRLQFVKPDGATEILEANSVILALPRRALELLELEDTVFAGTTFRGDLDAVIPVPACKLFMSFDCPWWTQSVFGNSLPPPSQTSVAYTDLPMRQCYYFGHPSPDQPALLMATYADDVASSFWSGLVGAAYGEPPRNGQHDPERDLLCSSLAMEESALQQLKAMHQGLNIPQPRERLFFDWSRDPYGAAWHAWAPYAKSWEVMPRIRQPKPPLSVFICGEAFAQHQGWVEGALNSAEKVMELMGLPRPGWVGAEHELEL